MKGNRVCILGGTGFVGRHLSTRLSAAGIACTIPSRHPQRHRDMLTTPGVKLVALNPYDPQQLQEALSGCRAAVNLVGILNESAHASFQRVHVELPNLLLRACKESGVPRLLHMSALNANEANGPSQYLKTKGLQECRYLVKDFGTSQSPKSTRQRDSRYCPDRPALITTPSRTLQQSCSCA
ncbi:MAG: hypothetical protein B0D96_08355, partial [Candidatus Sedimenticola endophacoides]